MRKIIALAVALAVFPAISAQQIWFAPNNTDMLNNNARDAEWSQTRDNVAVFKFYYQIIRDTPLPILKDKFNYLRSHNIKVAIEWPGLTWHKNGLGYKIEGFQEPGFSQKIIKKVKAANGYVDYLALDEPIFFAHFKEGKNHPQIDIPTIPSMIAYNVKPFYDAFPGIEVGDIEPINQMPPDVYKKVIPQFLSEYKRITGHPIAFMHADVYWQGDWKPAVEYTSKLMKENDSRFGVIFNSAVQSAQPYAWMMSARENIKVYLSGNSPLPDDVVMQSWNKSPKSPVGDTDPHSHSSLIQYFKTEEKLRR